MIQLLAALLVAATAARNSEKVENYPDGTKHLAYTVDSDGAKNGAYREFFPNGKIKISSNYRKDQLNGTELEFSDTGVRLRSAGYRDGKLNGPNLEFTKGLTTKSEFWIDGKLILPKSADQIAAEIDKINRSKITWIGEFPPVTAEVETSLKDAAVNSQREAALRALMSFRCICGLAYDLEMNRVYTAHAQAAARILSRIDKLTHTPDNPGLPDDEYKFAYKGTSSSNIHMMSPTGESLLNGMRDWMGDSDKSNVAKLGHRRWCLNPAMQSTGFGISGNYTAMWSMDSTRADIPDYDFIAFPPRGLTPVESFHDKDAFSVSLNPKKYAPPDEKEVKVTVRPARFVPRQGKLEKGTEALALEDFNVSLEGFAVRNCIIFRPVGLVIKPDVTYWVEITGLKDATGKATEIEYAVAFFSLSQTRPSHR